MPLRLIAGPANAGKVELLLDRYLAALEPAEPVLVVPNRADVDRVERELLARAGALLGGSIVTFDDLFDRIAAGGVAGGRSGAQSARSSCGACSRGADSDGFSESAARGGFAESLLQAFDELEAGLLEPEEVGGELGSLWAAYRAELRRARPLEPRHAAARAPSSGSAPTSTPGRRSPSSRTASRI